MSILANASTRILVQGITGREAATFTRDSLNYGARIVSGVTPGKGGQVVHGIPVFDTVAAALVEAPCDATVISVPPSAASDAAMEALHNGIKLLVVLTERIPSRDVITIFEEAERVQARVIGPNSLGLINPHQTRLGMCGGSAEDTFAAYSPGKVGIISRSGGMMTEIASMLTRAGYGQSSCVSIGGDPIVGTTMLDLLPLFEADPNTEALVLFCEPGGTMEEDLAEHLLENPSDLSIIAFVAGQFTERFQGMRFGHAGALVSGRKGSPIGKIQALKEAGVIVAQKLSNIPALIAEAIEGIST